MRLLPAVLVLPSLMLAGCVATGPYYPQEVGRVYGYDSYSYDPYPGYYYGPDIYYYSYRPGPDYYYRPGYGYYRPQAYPVRPSRPDRDHDHDHDHGRPDHAGHDHGSPRPPRPDPRPDTRPDRPDRPGGGLWGGIGRDDDRPPQPQRPSRPERPDRPAQPDRGPGLGWGGSRRPDAAPSRPSRPLAESIRPPRQERPQEDASGRGDGNRRRGWGRSDG